MTDTLTDDALLAAIHDQENRCEKMQRWAESYPGSNVLAKATDRAEMEYARLYDEAKRRGIADRLELPE